MPEVTFREVIREVLREEMRSNPRVLLLGENVATWGGGWKVTLGLAQEFGTRRVIETPVSENAIVGAALGGALAGLYMVAEVYSADFLFTAASEVLNDIAKWRYQHRWKRPMHLVLRMPMGAFGIAAGPEHSQCIEGSLYHTPGLTVVAPGTVEDAAGSFRAALRSPNPVVFLEHRRLYDRKAVLKDGFVREAFTELGRAHLARSGRDVTVVAWAYMRSVVEEAASLAEESGVSVEIIDPVTIRPFDIELVVESVRRTGRLLIVEESPRIGSVGAEIIASVFEALGHRLRAADRVAMPDVPHPFHPALEAMIVPKPQEVLGALARLMGNAVPA